jgi:4-hydroxy-3-methylbut-2-enyl diphosphate reductase
MPSLNLTVEIDNKSGFCFGVINAITLAEQYLNEKKKLYCLGDIVHNDVEIKRLRELGLEIISHEQYKTLTNTVVLLRAHGEPPQTYETAKQNNIELIDATCPVVLKLQNRVKKEYLLGEAPVYIFGKHGHAEVNGLLGQTNNEAVVFQSLEELKKFILPEKIILFCQTTMDTDEFYRIRDYLSEIGIEVELHNTICGQVSSRNKELREFVKTKDKVVFVSGKKSSNGKVLFEICRNYNPHSFFISSLEEMDESWFGKNERVGICGATSTPGWLMQQVKDKLESL